jgi:predicted 3-demethylubiquinone-9 3-methyltransferase (glyoxalase superfamily)
MPAIAGKIVPFLWFDAQAEDAARFYVSVFRNARLGRITRYGEAGHETHGKQAGSVLTVEFELEGLTFVALNGGPQFGFTEAVSFQVICVDQDEIDYYWSRLSNGGVESQCGWLKDRYGLSWQIVPAALPDMLSDADAARSERVMSALMTMRKFDLAALRRAHAGNQV